MNTSTPISGITMCLTTLNSLRSWRRYRNGTDMHADMYSKIAKMAPRLMVNANPCDGPPNA